MDLRIIEAAVADAEWAVEQAEADLKNIERQAAAAAAWTAQMNYYYCLAGGDGSGLRAAGDAPACCALPPVRSWDVSTSRGTLRSLKAHHLKQLTEHRDELRRILQQLRAGLGPSGSAPDSRPPSPDSP